MASRITLSFDHQSVPTATVQRWAVSVGLAVDNVYPVDATDLDTAAHWQESITQPTGAEDRNVWALVDDGQGPRWYHVDCDAEDRRDMAQTLIDAADEEGTIQAEAMASITGRPEMHTASSMWHTAFTLGCRDEMVSILGFDADI